MVKKLSIIVILLGVVAAFFYFDLGQYLTLEELKTQKEVLDQYYEENGLIMAAIYFGIYIVMASLSLPGATLLTLAGGAIFGRVFGVILISFASTIGATGAFLVARVLLGESIQKKYGEKLKVINEGVEKDGITYLFSLRLMPVFPFFLINLLMGLTKMPTWKFYLISQIGMFPGTIIYVNAGTALSNITSLGDILSLEIWGSFLLLGLFPVIVKWIAKFISKKKVAKN